jgi:hypothetical protein
MRLLPLIIRMTTEREMTSLTLISFYQTARRSIPEDSYIHTSRHKNLNSH